MRFVIALLVLLGCAPAPVAAVPPPDPTRFAAELAPFLHRDSLAGGPRDAVVFYGSSSIRFWHPRLAADFAPFTAVGRGFGGSTMSEAAHWVDRVVAPLAPAMLVLYVGDNDIEMGRTPAEVVRDFDLLDAKLRAVAPRTHMVVLAIKPSGARWAKWPAMRQANALLAAACARRPDLRTFVDVATPMLGLDGTPRPELYVADRLHMTPAGYDLWRSILQPRLLEVGRGRVLRRISGSTKSQ